MKNRLWKQGARSAKRALWDEKTNKQTWQTNKQTDSPRTTHLRTGKKIVKFLASSSRLAITWCDGCSNGRVCHGYYGKDGQLQNFGNENRQRMCNVNMNLNHLIQLCYCDVHLAECLVKNLKTYPIGISFHREINIFDNDTERERERED